MIPFLDLGAAYHELKTEIDEAVHRVLDSGWYILGEEVDQFEKEFAAYCEANHCIGVANGLDALVLALKALDIKAGDEVIVPSNTYIATWLAVSRVGATPVSVEPDLLTYNIDPALIESAITHKTRAIIAVHLYGQPANLEPIKALAQRHRLHLIEDAAQAHGAKYKNTKIGGHGDIVCWSFYPGKNLGALGDGGAITTNNSPLSDRLKMLRNYGSTIRYEHQMIGENSRLDSIQAAILRVKLQYLDDWNKRRKKIAHHYMKHIKNSLVSIPQVPQWAEPVWHLFVIKCDKRDALQSHLQNKGITTLIHYPIPPHRQKAYADIKNSLPSSPIADKLAGQILSLPIGPQQSEADTDIIINAINDFT